jgi:diguanylate cyclase (GGDEF)-like protein
VKKSIDFRNKIKFSNYELGKICTLLLSALTVVLIYKDSFASLNVYSVLAVLFIGAAVSCKVYTYLKNGLQPGSLIDKLEFPLLITLIFEIVIEIFGNELFPLSFILVPAIILYFGWMGGGLSLLVISVLQITRYPSADLPYQISLLLLSAGILGLLIKGGKGQLGSYIFKRDKQNQSPLQGLISGDAFKDEQTDAQSVKRLKSEIMDSMKILGELVPNHSVVLYIKMDDGMFVLADAVSKSKDYIDKGQRLNFRGGYLGWVLKTKTQVLITSVKNVRKNLIYYTRDVPVKSLLATPLFMKPEKNLTEGVQELFGMLIVDSLDQNAFGEKEKLIISLISDRIVEIIDRFQLSEKVKLSSKELNSYYDFTQKLHSTQNIDAILDHIMDTMEGLFEADFFGLTILAGEGYDSVLRRVSGEGNEHVAGKEVPHLNTLIGLVVESGKSFHSADLTARSKFRSIFGKEIDFALSIKNIKSILIYPLYENAPESGDMEQNVLGCVILGRKSKVLFNDGEISLAKIICSESSKSVSASFNYLMVKELAIKDGLTGLYNHRHFQEMLSYTIAHSERYSSEASIMLIDVDNLKSINDTYGHRAGDSALSSVGTVIYQTIRKIDVSARYGGDEFAVILPSTDKRGSLIVAEKIKNNLKKLPLKFKGEEIYITLSIGISTYPENASDREELIEKADRALYDSKEEGKDRITHFEDISLEELGT